MADEKDLTIVVGGQAGSEGKGAICARLHQDRKYQFAVRVGGPNAGHTVVGEGGKKYPLRQLPVAAVADPECQLVIAAGSEVDLDVLRYEIGHLEEDGYEVRNRLLLDREATVVEEAHKQAEADIRTGTTGKGIGAARAARAVRGAKRIADLETDAEFRAVDTQAILREAVGGVLLEGTQGHHLGSHAGYYPYCTSGDCRAIDFMAAAGLAPQAAVVWVVLRTHPIRIAGNSGPLEGETRWDEVGVEPEYTTVTQKIRRVAEWSWEWAQASVDANRGSGDLRLALTFADYWWPDVALSAGQPSRSSARNDWDEGTYQEFQARILEIEERLGAPVYLVGTGPNTQLDLRSVIK